MFNLISLRRAFLLWAAILAGVSSQLSASSSPSFERYEDVQNLLLNIRIRSFEQLSQKEQYEFLAQFFHLQSPFLQLSDVQYHHLLMQQVASLIHKQIQTYQRTIDRQQPQIKLLAFVSLDQLVSEYKARNVPPNLRLLNTATDLRDEVIGAFEHGVQDLEPKRRIRQLSATESKLSPTPEEVKQRTKMILTIIVFAWLALLIFVCVLLYIYHRTPSMDSLATIAKVQVLNGQEERFDVNNIQLNIQKDEKGYVIPKYLLDQQKKITAKNRNGQNGVAIGDVLSTIPVSSIDFYSTTDPPTTVHLSSLRQSNPRQIIANTQFIKEEIMSHRQQNELHQNKNRLQPMSPPNVSQTTKTTLN